MTRKLNVFLNLDNENAGVKGVNFLNFQKVTLFISLMITLSKT